MLSGEGGFCVWSCMSVGARNICFAGLSDAGRGTLAGGAPPRGSGLEGTLLKRSAHMDVCRTAGWGMKTFNPSSPNNALT